MSVLVLGIGGGGDVVGAYALESALRRFGVHAYIGAGVWERFVVDPVPGPLPLDLLEPVNRKGTSVGIVYGDTVASRGGRTFRPQIANVLSVRGGWGLAYDMNAPPRVIGREVYELCVELGVDRVIGVDVGGDVLADGCEATLHSPLADAISAAALYESARAGLKVEIGVMCPACDGELDRETVLSRLSSIASMGLYRGAIGLSNDDAPALERALSVAVSEASQLPYRALRGERGPLAIRGGTRTTHVDIISTLTFLVDVEGVYRVSRIVREVHGSSGLLDAVERLHGIGVATEYDYERLVAAYGPEVGLEKYRGLRAELCRWTG